MMEGGAPLITWLISIIITVLIIAFYEIRQTKLREKRAKIGDYTLIMTNLTPGQTAKIIQYAWTVAGRHTNYVNCFPNERNLWT